MVTEKARLTIDQVALMAGVSRSVVSRVLNNQPKVSEEARERVLRVIEQYGYRRSSVARSLATDRTYEICIITPHGKDDVVASGIWPLLHFGISEACMRRGYFVSLAMISTDTAGQIRNSILNDHVFDGYIPVTQEVADLVAPHLRSRNVPTILIGHNPAYPEFNSIDVDNFDGAYRATSHLIGMGHRRVALILGDALLQESVDRRAGYEHALREAGITLSEALIAIGAYSEENGHAAMTRWLRASPAPTAVFCASDSIAAGVLLALYRAGLNAPNDIAVVGFDDVPGSRYTTPPLTTVHQPIYEKGQRAADIIIDQIEGKSREIVHVNLPAKLVVRESCGAVLCVSEKAGTSSDLEAAARLLAMP